MIDTLHELVYFPGMKESIATTRQIRIEQPNGDSFAKRVNALCRHYAKLEGITDEERKQYVRDAVIRVFDNAEVAVYIYNGQTSAIV